MANEEQLSILRQGVETWNEWRLQNRHLLVDLSKADLSGAELWKTDLMNANLSEANLSKANLDEAMLMGANLTQAVLNEAILSRAQLGQANLEGADMNKAFLNDAVLVGANLGGAFLKDASMIRTYLMFSNMHEAQLTGVVLTEARLIETNLTKANLSKATLLGADLRQAILIDANLTRANLHTAQLSGADLSGADLSGADLSRASLIKTDLTGTILSGCKIFGISAWRLKLVGAIQSDLIITDYDEPEITVDNLEVAQFIYLLLNNQKIRDVIDTIGKKAVLILGRFTLPERKEVLEVMRSLLRERGLLPIVFDFEKSEERDFTETIKVLAGMCLFVIADITNPKSTPLELQGTVPDYMIPFAPIIQEGENPFAMFVDLQRKYREWVLPVRRYRDVNHLRDNFEHGIITPALQRHNELILLKNETLKIVDIDE